MAEDLAYVGVLAVEMFVVEEGGALRLLINEIAPRPHNSGHWTLDGARTDQFAQQIRAVCGVGLGSTEMVAPAAAIVNLLGDRWTHGEPDWSAVLAIPDAALHLYGKVEARPGRKMGHLTVLADTVEEAADLAIRLRDAAPARAERSGEGLAHAEAGGRGEQVLAPAVRTGEKPARV